MNKTQIEWAKNPDGSPGYTWNPITGCLNNCSYCYARKLANTRLKERYLANDNVAPTVAYSGCLSEKAIHSSDPFYPRFWEDKLYHPWGGKPKGVFVCDMSDLFGIGVPVEWTEKVMNLIRLHDKNRYYLLTKQPQNLAKFSPFPDNCWVGVSVTDGWQWMEAQHWLSKVEAKVKFVSFEPLLSEVRGGIIPKPENWLNWVIIGAQTKPTVMPKIEWVREIVEAADKAVIPVFLKDNLQPLFQSLDVLPEWACGDLGRRQEMPSE